jgi:hypothetical protein
MDVQFGLSRIARINLEQRDNPRSVAVGNSLACLQAVFIHCGGAFLAKVAS